MKYKDDALNALFEELEKTAVISDGFKQFIRIWAVEAVSQAYKRGVADEQARQAAAA
jgi:hypothetical protein